MARTKRDALEQQAGHTPPGRESRRRYNSSSNSEEDSKDQEDKTNQQTINHVSQIKPVSEKETVIARSKFESQKTSEPHDGQPPAAPKKRLNKLNPTQGGLSKAEDNKVISDKGASRPSFSQDMASPKAISWVQGVKLWEGKDGNPFKHGWPHKQPSGPLLQRMANLVAEETIED